MRKWPYPTAAAILAVLVVAIVAGVLLRQERHLPVNRDLATWIWDLDSLLSGNPEQASRVADFLSERQVRTVYLHAGSELIGKDEPLFRAFIQSASAKGIEVHALGGERNWATPDGRDAMREFLRHVEEYNETAPKQARFAGLHLDVEPYLLPQWDEDRGAVVRQWRETVTEMAAFARAHSLRSGVDLPFWLDSVPSGDRPSETLDRWMMEHADAVALMSYRNETEGEGGVLGLVSQEMEHARGTVASVYVGLNVAADSEAKLTFRGLPPDRFREALDRIRREYAGDDRFGGVAVHDLAAWMKLEGER